MAERYQQRGGYEQGETEWQQHQESHESGPGLPSWHGGYGSQSGQRPQGGQQSQWDASGGRGGQWRGGGAESHGPSGGQETHGPRGGSQPGGQGSPQGGGYGTHGGGYGSQSSYASHSNYGAEALQAQLNARREDTSHVGFGGLEYGGGGGSPAQGQQAPTGEHYPTQGAGWGEATHRSPGYQESPINYGQQGQTGYGPSGGYGDPDEPRGSQGYGTQRSGGWATRHGSYAAQPVHGAQHPSGDPRAQQRQQHYGGAPGSPGEYGRPPSGTALQSPYPEGPGRSGYSAHGGYAAHGGMPGPGPRQGQAGQGEAAMQHLPPSAGYGTHGGPGPEAYSRGGTPQPRETPAASSGAGMRQARRWPRGYQRSDERIKEDIYERLLERGDIEAEEVTVIVEGGCVRLEGNVPRRAMKHAIEDLVDDCPGVKDIDNRLRVTQPTGGGSSDRGSGGASGSDNITGGSAASGDQSGTYHSR